MQAQDRPGHLLSLKNIRKTFGGIRALKGVSLSLDEGEVLALVGENGAGKSTLVKVLTGIYHPEEGQINVRGSELVFDDAHAAGRAGIAAVHQETVMFDELSVAENIYMGRQPMKKGVIDWATMNSQAQVILDEIGAPFKSDVLVKSLGPAERHLVEISRALSQEAKVVILDEPTAALSRQEINDFYGIVRRLRDQGKGIIFITHKFDEIFSLADRYLVLRDGASVGEGRIADATEDSLVSLMVGRDLEHVYPTMTEASSTELLRVTNLNHPTEFENVNFALHKGEVLGFYGLVGAGRSEAMLALFGLKEHATGKFTLDGKPLVVRGPEDAISAGIAYVPEERQRQGAILSFSVRENLTLAALGRRLAAVHIAHAHRHFVGQLALHGVVQGAGRRLHAGALQQHVLVDARQVGHARVASQRLGQAADFLALGVVLAAVGKCGQKGNGKNGFLLVQVHGGRSRAALKMVRGG